MLSFALANCTGTRHELRMLQEPSDIELAAMDASRIACSGNQSLFDRQRWLLLES